MIALLGLESIGDDLRHRAGRLVAARGTVPHALRRVAHYLAADPVWVARIVGTDARFGLAREFVRPKKDYRASNGTGSRGVWLYYELRPGIYEVNARTSWRNNRRYFVRSVAGRLQEIDAAAARAEVSDGRAAAG